MIRHHVSSRLARRDERGAAAVVVSLLMTFVFIVVASFTVDLGLKRVARRDMQALADVVSLDLARLLDGRRASEVRSGDGVRPALLVAAAASLDRNDDNAVGGLSSCGGPCVMPYLVDLDANGEYAKDGNGLPVEVAGDVVPDAVVVVARTSVDFVFGIAASGTVTRRAVGTAESRACFRLGSFAAALNTGDTVLEDVFESMLTDAFGVQMRAIGYQGLVRSFVELDQLAAELGAGTVEELAALESLKVGTFLQAGARVLDSNGQTEAGAILGELAAKVSTTLTMNVADILTVGNGSAVRGSVNGLDLLGSTGLAVASEIANQNNFLDTGVVWADPWLSKGDVKLVIIEAPRQGCGRVGSRTSTAQIRLETNLGLELTGEKISGLALSTADGTNKSQVQVSASVAGATGTLTGLTCGAATDADPEEIRVRVDTEALAVDVSVPFLMRGEISTNGILSAAYLNSLGLGSIASATLVLDLDVRAQISTSLAAREGTVDTVYRVPPHDYLDPEPSPGAAGPVAIPTVRTATITARATPKLKVKLVGGLATTEVAVPFAELNLGGLRNAILHGPNRVGISLDNVTANVNGALVPVSELLGLQVGGADLFGVPRPECGAPSLVG